MASSHRRSNKELLALDLFGYSAAMRRWIVGMSMTLVLACGPAAGPVYDPSDGPMPDFSLADRNSNSPLFGQSISPRDYLEKISGWYFGHAT